MKNGVVKARKNQEFEKNAKIMENASEIQSKCTKKNDIVTYIYVSLYKMINRVLKK